MAREKDVRGALEASRPLRWVRAGNIGDPLTVAFLLFPHSNTPTPGPWASPKGRRMGGCRD